MVALTPDTPWHKRIIIRQRRLVGLVIPAAVFHALWWGIAIKYNVWHHFTDKYFIAITMIFGSMIAGQDMSTHDTKLRKHHNRLWV